MAKFKNNNIELLTNQTLKLGDSSEVVMEFDGTNLTWSQSSGGVAIDAHMAIGNTATVDIPGFPTYKDVVEIAEAFGSGVTGGGRGLVIQIDSSASDAGTTLTGVASVANLTVGTLHSSVTAGEFIGLANTNTLALTSSIGVSAVAGFGADNSTVTDVIGAKVATRAGFSMSGAVVTNMVAGDFQLLDVGSGDMSITNSFGLRVQAPGFTPSGTLTKSYGLYIADQSGWATDNWNVYSEGVNAEHRLEGHLQVDGTTTVDTLIVNSLVSMPEGSMQASDFNYDEVAPATYSTGQEAMQELGSAGLISGGIISADGTSSVSVTAGTGMLRTTDDNHAPIVFIDFPQTSGIQIPEDETKNIVVSYNGGNIIVEASDPGSADLPHTSFLLGQSGEGGGELFISNLRQRISDFRLRMIARLYSTDAVVRAGNEGMILGESADNNRYVTMTSGDVWALLDVEPVAAFNSGTGDTFTSIYRDTPSGYVETPGETQWPADFYDNDSGTLAALSNNRYGVRWFYLLPTGDDMFMVYGTGNWKSLAEAEAESVPTEIPSLLSEYGILIGKIICQKNVTIAAEVSSAFDETYNFSGVTNHGNLSNLGSPFDDHTQYSLINGNRDFTGTVGGIYPVDSDHLTTKQYVDEVAYVDSTQVVVVHDHSDLDTGGFVQQREQYVVQFETDRDPPPWKEGRVFWDKDNNTFAVYNDVSEVTLQVGQETHIKVRNESGSLIGDGTICYIVGASADRATILPAIANSELTSEGIVVATHDISHNEDGYGTVIGRVGGLDTSAFSEGDEVYLSPTVAGTMTNTRPSAPDYVVDIGNVIVSDATTGSILVQLLNHGDFQSLADVNIPTTPENGQTLVYNEDNEYWQPETQVKVISYTLPLSGVTDNQVPLTGTFVIKASGVTGDDATDYPISNQHVWILINSITGNGNITITGTSLSESTAVPVTADTETIYVSDATSTGVYYQTTKKWWEITNIDIPAGITAIDYDHGALGYPDMGNRNFKILGYRLDAYASGNSPDMRLIISKVQDVGDKAVEFFDLEDAGVDSGAAGNQIVDHVRTGGQDRSYNPTVDDVWLNDETFTFKQLDFDDYWTNDENEIFAAESDSGYFIRIEGEPDGTGITNVDFVDLLLYYALL